MTIPMSRILRTLRLWLSLATAIIGLSGLFYVVAQQVLRQTANDPQVQMANDAAVALAHGTEPAAALPPGQVDFAQSLAPFMIIYDSTGKVLAASGTLRGHVPSPPPGALAYALANGENRVTWQPEGGVRLAAVIQRTTEAKPRLVLAARSLREVEWRTAQLGLLTAVGVLALLLAVLVVIGLFDLATIEE
jgi:hypothetical protein